MSKRSRRSLAPMILLMAVALIMLAAPVYVLLGEKGIAVSPSFWKLAVDLCRGITGLFGILTIVSVVPGRRSGPSGEGALGSLVAGALLIVAAIADLGLTIVITGLAGLGLLFAGGAVVVEAFRATRAEPGQTQDQAEGIELFRDSRAITDVER